jgi:predicted transcriptional regulator
MSRLFAHRTLALAALCICALASEQVKIGEPAGPLLLTDQYEHPFELAGLLGSVVVLIDGDRTGSNFSGVWGRAVRARYKAPDYPQLKIIFAAHLTSAPGFLHGFVRSKFMSKDAAHPASPILLDWQGAIARRYGFRDDVANVYVIDRDGILRYKGSGRGTESDLDPLFRILETLLDRSSCRVPIVPEHGRAATL